jgi:hypothetical protein
MSEQYSDPNAQKLVPPSSQPNPPTLPVVKAEKPAPTAEEVAAQKKLAEQAVREEKKNALRAELAKLEADEPDGEKTLEERVFALESTVASIAGHPQPVKPVKKDEKVPAPTAVRTPGPDA